MACIWRAYLNSELSDNFGPIPALSAFTDVPGEYNKVEDIYTYILKELKEAVASLDESIDMSAMSKYDPFFGDIKEMEKVWKLFAYASSDAFDCGQSFFGASWLRMLQVSLSPHG